MSKKVTLKGKTYDLADVADLVSIQNELVPDNWPGKKPDCVRLYINLAEMLAFEFRRHFAANYKRITQSAFDSAEAAGGGKATQAVSFSFEVDMTSLMVAAITATKMGGSTKFGSVGKPKTHDINQGEFLNEGNEVILDAGTIDKENEAAEFAAEKEKAEAKAAKEAAKKGEPGAPAVDKPKRVRKKKDTPTPAAT